MWELGEGELLPNIHVRFVTWREFWKLSFGSFSVPVFFFYQNMQWAMQIMQTFPAIPKGVIQFRGWGGDWFTLIYLSNK